MAREDNLIPGGYKLTVDLTVCKLMCDEPLKEWKIYLEKFKKEIDNLYERVSNR